MLSKRVIDIILNDGSFFEDEIDLVNKEPKTTDEAKDWFTKQYKIEDRNSAFIEFYNLVGSPPVGNGPDLFDLEQINTSKNNFTGTPFILIASGDTGSYVYNTSNDTVYEYDFMVNGYDDIKEMCHNPCAKWGSFSAFLDTYYTR